MSLLYADGTAQTDPYERHNLYPLDHDDTMITFQPSQTNHDLLFSPADFPTTSGSTAHVLSNTTSKPSVQSGTSLHRILSRLDTFLMVTKTCTGRACTHPWEVLHPGGEVKNLHDALSKEFDDFYEREQERVQFSRCEKGFIAESEGPTGMRQWTVGSRWQDLV